MSLGRGILIGMMAGGVWVVANLAFDAVFRTTVVRHQDQLNPKLLGRPGLLVALLTGWLVLVGGVFGAVFSLVYPALPGAPLTKGLFFGGVLLFLPFARAPLEGSVLTSSPRQMLWFFLGEGFVGLMAYGLALGALAS